MSATNTHENNQVLPEYLDWPKKKKEEILLRYHPIAKVSIYVNAISKFFFFFKETQLCYLFLINFIHLP